MRDLSFIWISSAAGLFFNNSMLNGGLRWNKHEAIDLISSIMRAHTQNIDKKWFILYSFGLRDKKNNNMKIKNTNGYSSTGDVFSS